MHWYIDIRNSTVDMFDPFKAFDMDKEFDINLSELKKMYLNLLGQFHPDRFIKASASEKLSADQFASTINRSYEILKDPLERARSLLLLKGYIGESDVIEDFDLIEEILPLQEEIEEAETPKNLNNILDRINTAFDTARKAFADGYKMDQDQAILVKSFNRMAYYRKLEDKILRLLAQFPYAMALS